MRSIFVDTSALYALLDRADRDHEAARRTIEDLVLHRVILFTTNFVRAEAYTLIGVRLSWNVARTWLAAFDLPIERVTAEDERHAVDILLRHDDKSYSFVDATSFAVMQRMGVTEAFAFDRHFAQFGFRAVGLDPLER